MPVPAPGDVDNSTTPLARRVARFVARHLLTYGVVASLVCVTYADDNTAVVAPRIPALERVLAAGKGAPARDGQVLWSELHCAACHDRETPAAPAPLLQGIAGRQRAAHLIEFIADPHHVKPGTVMPQVVTGDPAARRRQAEAIVHFLASTGDSSPPQEYATTGSQAAGERLFLTVGCGACHDPPGSPPLVDSKPLGRIEEKYTLPTLTAFLRNPHETRPAGRMPSLGLSIAEARELAAYLLRTPEVAHIRYRYFEGNWNDLPDFDSLKPVAEGSADTIDVGPRKRDNQFGLVFEGYLQVTEEEEYTFHVGADDGVRLLIDGKVVAENPGVHPYGVKSGKRRLTPGPHRVRVEYFEQAGEEQLTADCESPKIPRRPLASLLSSGERPQPLPDLTFQVDADKAREGAELFATIGCAACHAVERAGSRITSRLPAPQLDANRLEGGCLTGAGKAPRFDLSDTQRAALRASIGAPIGEHGAVAQVATTMLRFNCLACHPRDGLGGVAQEREARFQTSVPEVGDEGRIPPPLDGIGAKLTAEWLDGILAEGAHDRPYMLTRMPKFGAAAVGHLRPLFERLDSLPEQPNVEFHVGEPEIKEAGRRMAGIRGFSCTQCHTFGRFQARGIQSIDMQTMTRRLREDWFRAYLRNPPAFRPRTRMPSPWPQGRRSLLQNVLDGDSEQQILAIWRYLADGPRAKIPEGLITESMELIPIDEPVIYRNFIEGAGPRAIGVGYPEHLHLAFDANELRPALLWEGRFIDASRHWSGRGQGFEPPAGDNVLSLPSGATLAHLESFDTPWPASPRGNSPDAGGWRFRGYRLDQERRPTFLYQNDEVAVDDFYDTRTAAGQAPVRRTLTLKWRGGGAPTSGWWLRAAEGGELAPQADGWFQIDQRWRTRVTGGGEGTPRESSGRRQLLVPIEWRDGVATLRQEYQW